MTDKDRDKTETNDDAKISEKKQEIITDDEMSKINGGSITVDIGSFGLPEFGNGSS